MGMRDNILGHRQEKISLARLDRFYCFKQKCNIVKSCDIKSVGFSDHSIVIFTGFIANIKSKIGILMFLFLKNIF